MKKVFFVLPALMLLLVAGCLGPKRAEHFQPMEVSFEWRGNAGSYDSSPNPEIHVRNVPAGTAFLDVYVKDLQRPGTFHGGGTVAYDGSGVIAVGALNNYRGPQPPAPEVHTYVFRVRALNADKSLVLGEGEASRKYPE